ncbi:MAG: hypothetical protein H7301_04165 [Cryobacterium sp.]|nr:hypothetical protein [Oligoflexia bacterium]
MKLPAGLLKIEKKHVIAGALIASVAAGAFFMGTRRSDSKSESPEHAVTGTKSDSSSDRKTGSATSGEHRSPAAAPADDHDSRDEESSFDEEVDVQIAHAEIAKSDTRGVFTRVVDTYADAVQTVNEKVRNLSRAEEENRKLKMENAYLRVMVETRKFSCESDAAKAKTETVGKKLVTAHGSKAARSLASIRYQFPENLLPEQLLALGVGYFKVKDDEKAAVILHFLTEMEEGSHFKTASNYLMAGISFYRLENYKGADQYFEKVVSSQEKDDETLKAKRQANYWKALVAEQMKNPQAAQKLLLESMEDAPHAKEALWVNPKGIIPTKTARTGSSGEKSRLPASEKNSAPEHGEKEHHDGHSEHH